VLRTLRDHLWQSGFAGRAAARSVLLLGVILSAAWADAATEAEAPATTANMSVVELVEQVRPSLAVVSVSGRDGKLRGVGTGFVVDPLGLIATNLHVIGEGRPFEIVLGDGRRLDVLAVHASDRHSDLAIVRVKQTGLPALPLGELSDLKQGAPIVVMGNPHGLEASVVTGVNSGVREINGRKMIQLAIPVEPGNSGGPVMGHDGHVYGVVTLKSAITNNLGFAGDVSTLRKLLAMPNPVTIERWRKIGALDPAKWQVRFGGNWQQRGGRIAVTGVGDGFGGRSLCLAQQQAPDLPYEVAVQLRLDDEAGAAGLVFHSDGGDRHYGFYPSAGKLRLTLFDGPVVFQWKILHNEPSEHYRPGMWNSLKVRIEKDRIQGFVNDSLVVESKNLKLTSGMVGLAKFRATQAEFRDFRVAEEIPPTRLAPQLRARLERQVDKLGGLAHVLPEQVSELVDQAAASRRVIQQRAQELERQADDLRKLELTIHAQHVARQVAAILQVTEAVGGAETDPAQDARAAPDSPGGAQQSIDLLRAALLIARLDDAEVDIQAYVDQVDRMAAEVKASLGESATGDDTIRALDHYLFREQGYHGSRFDYENRANSYLNSVLTDREGIPISLSVLYMELGRRLGLRIDGIGLPGHFVVRYFPSEGAPQVIDVFHEAKRLDRDALEELTARYGHRFHEGLLKPQRPAAIVTRMLKNLQRIAETRGDHLRMLGYLELMVAIDPTAVQARGMRAVVRHEMGQEAAAVADLDWILEHRPPGLDLRQIERMKAIFQRE